jgi:hypothetical protein
VPRKWRHLAIIASGNLTFAAVHTYDSRAVRRGSLLRGGGSIWDLSSLRPPRDKERVFRAMYSECPGGSRRDGLLSVQGDHSL